MANINYCKQLSGGTAKKIIRFVSAIIDAIIIGETGMIGNICFTGKEVTLAKVTKEAKNAATEYVGEGKIFSDEARFWAESRQKGSRHPYFAPDTTIIHSENKPAVVQNAKDVDVDFFAESTPHRFSKIG